MTNALDVPVLFLIFNRPDVTATVFEKIREARPRELFVACDGPRDHVPADRENVAACQAIVAGVDWPCEVKQLYRTENLGSGHALHQAITWFFEQVEAGIILEDDCVPAASFFPFCAQMLVRYRDRDEVSMISGTNYMVDTAVPGDPEASYFLTRYCHIWGWATWASRWHRFVTDGEPPAYTPQSAQQALDNTGLKNPFFRWYWNRAFRKREQTAVPDWDYRWLMHCWGQGGRCILPCVNQISNIGHGPEATRTRFASRRIAALPVRDIEPPYQAPREFVSNRRYDRYYEWNITVLESVLMNEVRKLQARLSGLIKRLFSR